jgi:hypothetical protein
MTMSRRTVLRALGIQLALPMLSSVLPREARAESRKRKHFIAVYFPNGAYMPAGQNGSWTFGDALAPLGDYARNTMVLRGLHNGFSGIDPHWQNCAGFMSCSPIELGDPGIARCAKSLDQYVAEALPSPKHSLEIGGIYYHRHLLNDHPGYSHDYLNRISWQSADTYRSPVADPARLFSQLFGDGSVASEAVIAYRRSRKLSILDHLHKDATRLTTHLPGDYRPVLDAYMQSVREIEQQVSQPVVACPGAPAAPTGDFSQPNVNYIKRFELMHDMLVLALQCGLTNVGSIMYGPSVSDDINFSESLGAGSGHHAYAHHGGTADRIARLKQITRVQTGLLAHLLKRLDQTGLLADTLVLYGSDMSDGDVHLTENLPVLLCGAGDDLRFGQEVGTREARRPLSDLHMEILKLLGVNGVASFGTGECQSTGSSLGLTV